MVLFNLFICEIKSYYFLIKAGFIAQNHECITQSQCNLCLDNTDWKNLSPEEFQKVHNIFNKILAENQFYFLLQVISSYIARDIKFIIKYRSCEHTEKKDLYNRNYTNI